MTLPPLIEAPLHHLLARREGKPARWIVGMAGVPGSGKSTLAARLTAEVNALAGPDTMIALGMDGFHLPKVELSRMPDPEAAFARRGAPWTFAPDALRQRLQALRENAGREAVPWPDFQHEIGDPVEAAQNVPPETQLILVEGLYLLHPADGWQAISPLFDERWYLDTPVEIAMERLARRHMRAWGWTRADAESRIAANDRLNAEIVAASRPFADWRVL
jgi:pantothenate kinase